jgi:nucleotide-binding universal stress UspA family protein
VKRFKEILCVITTPGTGRAVLDRAVSLAQNNQARLTAVSVADHVSLGMGMPEGGPISIELQAAVVKAAGQKLEKAVEPFLGRMAIETRVLVGVQFFEIIREVLRHGHDLVIKSAEDPEWLERLLGSEDMHLLRKCPCPVWLIKPGAPRKYRTIMAAVDLDEAHPEEELETRRELNHRILELASSLALANFAELHLVHAWEAVGEGAMRAGFLRMTEDKVDDYVRQVKCQREADMDRLLQELNSGPGESVLDCIEHQVHLVKGAPRRVIPEVARKIEADMVVMGTVARTGVPGFIAGNAAEMILGQINSSVLAIKPEGYRTPVTLED